MARGVDGSAVPAVGVAGDDVGELAGLVGDGSGVATEGWTVVPVAEGVAAILEGEAGEALPEPQAAFVKMATAVRMLSARTARPR